MNWNDVYNINGNKDAESHKAYSQIKEHKSELYKFADNLLREMKIPRSYFYEATIDDANKINTNLYIKELEKLNNATKSKNDFETRNTTLFNNIDEYIHTFNNVSYRAKMENDVYGDIACIIINCKFYDADVNQHYTFENILTIKIPKFDRSKQPNYIIQISTPHMSVPCNYKDHVHEKICNNTNECLEYIKTIMPLYTKQVTTYIQELQAAEFKFINNVKTDVVMEDI